MEPHPDICSFKCHLRQTSCYCVTWPLGGENDEGRSEITPITRSPASAIFMTSSFFPYPWIIPSIPITSQALSIADGSKMKSTSLIQIFSISGSIDISNLTCSIWIHDAPTPTTLPSPEILALLIVTEINCAHGSPGSVPPSWHVLPHFSFSRARYRRYSYYPYFTHLRHRVIRCCVQAQQLVIGKAEIWVQTV